MGPPPVKLMRVENAPRPTFVFYNADRLGSVYVGVRRNGNLFHVASHIRMNLLTNLWLKFIASKQHG